MIQLFKLIYSFIQCYMHFSVTHIQFLDYTHLLATYSTFKHLSPGKA